MSIDILNFARQQVFIVLMVLVDDLDSFLNRKDFLIVAKCIFFFTVECFVSSHPFNYFLNSSRVLLLEAVYVSNTSIFGISFIDSKNLPIELTLVNEAEATNNLELRHLIKMHITAS